MRTQISSGLQSRGSRRFRGRLASLRQTDEGVRRHTGCARVTEKAQRKTEDAESHFGKRVQRRSPETRIGASRKRRVLRLRRDFVSLRHGFAQDDIYESVGFTLEGLSQRRMSRE